MGPEATNQLVLKIIDGFLAMGQKTRPNILVSFVPVNLENETRLINENDIGDFPILLIKAAISLENGGADFIVIACNTVHFFIDLIRKSVKIPVLSVLEEVEIFLKKNNINKTAIIGSSFTVKNKLFDFKEIELIRPNEISQKFISKELNKLAKRETCLLACSETQLLNLGKFKDKIHFVDTMQILADISIKNLLS